MTGTRRGTCAPYHEPSVKMVTSLSNFLSFLDRYERFYFREYTPCFNDVVVVSGVHLSFFIVCAIRYECPTRISADLLPACNA